MRFTWLDIIRSYSFPSSPWAVGRPEARELGSVHGPARHGGKRARAGPARAPCRAWAAPQARGSARPGMVSGRPDSARGPAREHEAHEARQPEPAGHIRGRGRPRALVTLAPLHSPPWLLRGSAPPPRLLRAPPPPLLARSAPHLHPESPTGDLHRPPHRSGVDPSLSDPLLSRGSPVTLGPSIPRPPGRRLVSSSSPPPPPPLLARSAPPRPAPHLSRVDPPLSDLLRLSSARSAAPVDLLRLCSVRSAAPLRPSPPPLSFLLLLPHESSSPLFASLCGLQLR